MEKALTEEEPEHKKGIEEEKRQNEQAFSGHGRLLYR